ncbi:PREDICTED: activating signal cointegrator 1 complex subunit 1-like [Branchiostoma belcheri]|uniref:Activating signal cointegrator 1 complex subunit 1-like n=1 Tax=Branchiostoma belcheri TaxID=7741 RepID=A0A6P4XUT7_BRABE|nr:PREDICTED: activating signal cointegrator 1 complex subunit 1-like [Branchiostoma belcheri]XP_019620391.1 PREDICTED: activating signal cointegrator 1 complex subunit 1-like [Branchiostoma belcheri]XP_019620392.1 PREDICTED: activating signal cointegrator 1 complex subunit 1-like [Branchiostoma belcheri]
MDVLRPDLVWVDGRCYRKNFLSDSGPDEQQEEEEDVAMATGCRDNVYADESCDIIPVQRTDRGYKLTLDLPSDLFKFIIGRKGETKKRLETETRSQVQIPKVGAGGEVVITGSDKQGVLSAMRRIQILADSGRAKLPFTHFLSLPLTTTPIKEGFQEFQSSVLAECGQDQGIDASIFQNPDKLHLTLTTLVLLTEKEVAAAERVLKECVEDLVSPLLRGKPLQVDVRGIEYMNDDPAMVDVLYAQVHLPDGSDKLQTMADGVVERFVSAGLTEQEYDRVKLHTTVMNTLFRRDPSASPDKSSRKAGKGRPLKERESFDARNVLKIFGDFHFGKTDLNSIHLSERFSSDSKTGYYNCAAAVELT